MRKADSDEPAFAHWRDCRYCMKNELRAREPISAKKKYTTYICIWIAFTSEPAIPEEIFSASLPTKLSETPGPEPFCCRSISWARSSASSAATLLDAWEPRPLRLLPSGSGARRSLRSVR